MAPASDKVPVVCPNCNKRLLVPAGTLGKQGRCPACQTVFTLEQLWEAEPVAPAPPTMAPLAPLSPFSAPAAPAQNAWGAPPQSPFANSASNPWGSPAAPAPAGNPFGNPGAPQPNSSQYGDDDFQGDYQLQAAPPVPTNPYSSPAITPVSSSYAAPYSKPRKEKTWDSSVLGGLFLMFISVVVFFGALALGWIVPYMIILFFIGLFAFVKGLFSGNLAGD